MPKTLMLCSLSDTTPIIVFYYSTTLWLGATRKLSLAAPKPCAAPHRSRVFGCFFKKVLQFFEKSPCFWHQIWYYSLADFGKAKYGRLAQLVEHLLDVQEVTGSSPVPSTIQFVLEPDSLRKKGSGTFFVYRRFCGRTTRNGKRAKAGYHYDSGILPFALGIKSALCELDRHLWRIEGNCCVRAYREPVHLWQDVTH